jgi:predicted amidohydrolase YtcJ
VLIVGAEIEGRGPIDVRLLAGRVSEVGVGLKRQPGEPLLAAAGGALLPGLHDHHIHLLALAASESSLQCGPPEIETSAALARSLTAAGAGQTWLRGVGYHESVAGSLGREDLDRWQPRRPVRIQHRSGAMWMLNSAAIERLGLDKGTDAEGVERDRDGGCTGRLFGLDLWLRERLGDAAIPPLGAVAQTLAGFGVTGVTDATVSNTDLELSALGRATESGELPQRVLAMGGIGLSRSKHPRVARGAVKIVLAERRLPKFDELRKAIEVAHEQGRSVAIHCVTRAELVFALTAFSEAGAQMGDRLEHASIAPPDCLDLLAGLPLTVVTQPGFLRQRGDAYAVDVEPRDRPWLYRGRGFLKAGVLLAAGSDAPFGPADPWLAMRAAVDRRSAGGRCLGERERLTPDEALALFQGTAEAPGAGPRRVAVGADADLCLLDCGWETAREELSSERVKATWCGGSLVYQRG